MSSTRRGRCQRASRICLARRTNQGELATPSRDGALATCDPALPSPGASAARLRLKRSRRRRRRLAPGAATSAGWPGVAAPGGKQQRVEVSLGRLLVVHLKSVVVPGRPFCCDAEQHSPPASVRVADQPRADDDATSSLTPINCPLGEGSFTATGRLRCSPPNVVRPVRIGFPTQKARH